MKRDEKLMLLYTIVGISAVLFIMILALSWLLLVSPSQRMQNQPTPFGEAMYYDTNLNKIMTTDTLQPTINPMGVK